MRLLLVADLHYSLPQFDWVLDMAPDFDVVVMAGDHLDVASIVDGRAQSVVVRKYFSRLRAKTRLLICSGNHDLDSKNDAGEKVARWLGVAQNEGVPSDGESFVLDDTLFTICPWWDGPIVRAGIGEQLAEAASRRTKRWIWVHHAPPAASPISWGGARYFGDVELRAWIEQLPAGHRSLRPRASIALHHRRLVGRSHRPHLGVQCRATAGRAADPHRHRHRCGRGDVVLRGKQSIRPPRPAARAAGAAAGDDSGLAQSRGSVSRSGPSVKSSCCWWISVSRTSPTMPR